MCNVVRWIFRRRVNIIEFTCIIYYHIHQVDSSVWQCVCAAMCGSVRHFAAVLALCGSNTAAYCRIKYAAVCGSDAAVCAAIDLRVSTLLISQISGFAAVSGSTVVCSVCGSPAVCGVRQCAAVWAVWAQCGRSVRQCAAMWGSVQHQCAASVCSISMRQCAAVCGSAAVWQRACAAVHVAVCGGAAV
jgi:hypothetical protein